MASKSRPQLLTVGAALAALVGPTSVAGLNAEAHGISPESNATSPGSATGQTLTIAVGDELMAFTVNDSEHGGVVADHASHASHASHSSHSSHASSRY